MFTFALEIDINEKDKVEHLYLRYNQIMYYIAYNILLDYQLAQDAVHMSFLKIIENIEKIDEIECNKTKAFVGIICRNISLNLYNKRKKESPLQIDDLEETILDTTILPDERVINNEIFEKIKNTIKRLYPPYADIITLKYTFNYSDSTISELLGISLQNVRVRLHRARRSLMQLLKQEDAEV